MQSCRPAYSSAGFHTPCRTCVCSIFGLEYPRPRELMHRRRGIIPSACQLARMKKNCADPGVCERRHETKSTRSIRSMGRSVAGMKSLMPLKLSPSLLELPYWPSTIPNHNPEPGARGSCGCHTNLSTTHSFDYNNQQASLHSTFKFPALHRDTPIYIDQGSPLLGQVYYNGGNLHSPSSPPWSTCHEPFIADRFETFDREESELEECYIDFDNMIRTLRHERRSIVLATSQPGSVNRTSLMSSQFLGRSWLHDEAALLSSPLNGGNDPGSEGLCHLLPKNVPQELDIESWMSETDSCYLAEEDLVGFATELTPSRATVVDVGMHRASGLSITIPVPNPLMAQHGSWMIFGGSPPPSPSEPLEPQALVGQNQAYFMRTSHLAMRSPPPSPTGPPLPTTSPPLSPTSLHETPSSPKVTPKPSEIQNTTSKLTAQPLIYDLLSGLEDRMAVFPSRMIFTYTPCILAIRSHLHGASSYSPHRQENGKAPLSTLLPEHQKYASKETSLGSHPLSLPKLEHENAPRLPTPDLEPLRRIFPDTSNFMRLALYSHVLAYLFVTSLPETEHFSGTSETSIPGFLSRVNNIEGSLWDKIGTLIVEMEGNHDVRRKPEEASVTLLRLLIEIVMTSEGL